MFIHDSLKSARFIYGTNCVLRPSRAFPAARYLHLADLSGLGALSNSAGYDAQRALYPADVLGWLQTSHLNNCVSLIKPDLAPPPGKPKKNGYSTGFHQSKKVRDGLANKLWDYSSDTADLIDYVRKMPPEQFMAFMLEMGLYELLRGERKFEEVGN